MELVLQSKIIHENKELENFCNKVSLPQMFIYGKYIRVADVIGNWSKPVNCSV